MGRVLVSVEALVVAALLGSCTEVPAPGQTEPAAERAAETNPGPAQPPSVVARVAASHMQLTVYARPSEIVAGERVSLVIDSVPDSGIHVYAPSVVGYLPIDLSIEPQPGVTVDETDYPQPESYYFEPLDETVPVFSSPFQISQDVVIDANAFASLRPGEPLRLSGTLFYQACDDRLCFSPREVPLEWTLVQASDAR